MISRQTESPILPFMEVVSPVWIHHWGSQHLINNWSYSIIMTWRMITVTGLLGKHTLTMSLATWFITWMIRSMINCYWAVKKAYTRDVTCHIAHPMNDPNEDKWWLACWESTYKRCHLSYGTSHALRKGRYTVTGLLGKHTLEIALVIWYIAWRTRKMIEQSSWRTLHLCDTGI